MPIRVLVTNLFMTGFTGTEMAAHDVAIGLQRRGHAVAATWAVAVRPRTFLDAEVLGDRLLAAWEYNLGSIRTKDVAKAVRRWNR